MGAWLYTFRDDDEGWRLSYDNSKTAAAFYVVAIPYPEYGPFVYIPKEGQYLTDGWFSYVVYPSTDRGWS
jgi:hypothetical protein